METTYFSSEPVRMVMAMVFIILLYLFFTGSQKTKQWCMAVVLLIAVSCLVIAYIYPPVPGISYGELLGGSAMILGELLLLAVAILVIGAGIFCCGRFIYRYYFRKDKKNRF